MKPSQFVEPCDLSLKSPNGFRSTWNRTYELYLVLYIRSMKPSQFVEPCDLSLKSPNAFR
jgi:hypothetical protein